MTNPLGQPGRPVPGLPEPPTGWQAQPPVTPTGLWPEPELPLRRMDMRETWEVLSYVVTVVVDASVVIKWLLQDPERETGTEKATQLMESVTRGELTALQPSLRAR